MQVTKDKEQMTNDKIQTANDKIQMANDKIQKTKDRGKSLDCIQKHLKNTITLLL